MSGQHDLDATATVLDGARCLAVHSAPRGCRSAQRSRCAEPKTQVANPSFTPLGWALTIPVSTGNFFETTLAPTVNTIGFGLTGGYTGQTINLKVIQPSPNPGTITWGSNVEFPDGFDSAASTGVGDIDIWSFVTFDGNTWYGTGLKNFS